MEIQSTRNSNSILERLLGLPQGKTNFSFSPFNDILSYQTQFEGRPFDINFTFNPKNPTISLEERPNVEY